MFGFFGLSENDQNFHFFLSYVKSFGESHVEY